jgi:hypothetical protein
VNIRGQGITLFTALCVLIGTLVIIQLWLVAASLDALLSDETKVLVPAAVASFALFFINGGLVLYALDFDKKVRHRGSNE